MEWNKWKGWFASIPRTASKDLDLMDALFYYRYRPTGSVFRHCTKTCGYRLQVSHRKGWERKREIGQKVEFRWVCKFKLFPLPYRLMPAENNHLQLLAPMANCLDGKCVCGIADHYGGVMHEGLPACIVYACLYYGSSLLGAFCVRFLCVGFPLLIVNRFKNRWWYIINFGVSREE